MKQSKESYESWHLTRILFMLICLFNLRYLLTISSRVGRRDCGVSWRPPLPPLPPRPPLPPFPLLLWGGWETESGWWTLWAPVPSEKDFGPTEGRLSWVSGRIVFRIAWFSCTRSLALWMGVAETQEQRLMGILDIINDILLPIVSFYNSSNVNSF